MEDIFGFVVECIVELGFDIACEVVSEVVNRFVEPESNRRH